MSQATITIGRRVPGPKLGESSMPRPLLPDPALTLPAWRALLPGIKVVERREGERYRPAVPSGHPDSWKPDIEIGLALLLDHAGVKVVLYQYDTQACPAIDMRDHAWVRPDRLHPSSMSKVSRAARCSVMALLGCCA